MEPIDAEQGPISLFHVLSERDLPPEALAVPLPAAWRGVPVIVRAVLERTAVVFPAATGGNPEERSLVQLDQLMVAAERLRWRKVPAYSRNWGEGRYPGLHRPRQCIRCRHGELDVEFPPARSSFCRGCRRQLSREWRARRKTTGAAAA
ncbi:MAG: hypothetical protein ACR2MZ_03455 [Candidatus Dormibacter sp.]|uniref:hypothetical protein n=1 Tax=Candidatus Dormibacter sp. TaxID=2973982 RepID=UPI0026BF65DF